MSDFEWSAGVTGLRLEPMTPSLCVLTVKLLVEQGAVVECRASAVRCRLEPASHQERTLDQGVHLRQLPARDFAKALRNSAPTVRRCEQLSNLVEAKARTLASSHDRQRSQDLG
jgi:hypothetical protein